MTEQTFMQRAVALSLEKMRANSGGPFGAVKNRAIIAADLRRFDHVINTDEVRYTQARVRPVAVVVVLGKR